MPWQRYVLLPQEYCQVKNVHFVVGPPTMCSITLGKEGGREGGEGEGLLALTAGSLHLQLS